MKKLWKRYRFKTKAHPDYRPLIFNPKYPWWCSGFDDNDNHTIIAYLPEDEDLFKYWDDAYEIDYTTSDEIEFTSRFPKPSYFQVDMFD